MKIKKRKAREKRFSGPIGGLPADLVYQTSPITGNLFFRGTFDGETVEGFVNKGQKRGTLGAFAIDCDALSRRNYKPFIYEVACVCRFNGFKPMKKGSCRRGE